jgi:putative ABC transport system ATP-binding protein
VNALEVEGLHKSVGLPPKVLFDGVGFKVAENEMIAVCGQSGCGKSSLLHVLAGMDTNYEGAISICGRLLRTLDDRARAAVRLRTVGMVFQTFHLVDHLTAAENVMLPSRFGSSTERQAAPGRAAELLEAVGLGARVQALPRELSGGERQRVAIARALLMRPALVLADEPTGNLDRQTASQVLALLESLVNRVGGALVVVTHDPFVAKRAHRTLRLHSGRITAD